MNKKILIITPGFPKDENDSSCVPYLQDYIIALSNKIGAENIKVVATQYPFKKNIYYWKGIEVIPSGGENKKSFHYYFTLKRTMKNISRLFKKDSYLVHAFWLGEAAFIGNRTVKKFFTHMIVTLMGQDVKPGNRVMPYLQRDTTWFVALSKNQAATFHKNYKMDADDIIPFPLPNIDPATLHRDREIDLLFVGSFIEVKQPFQFISLVKKLKNDFPEIKAVMAGGGKLSEKINELINTEQLHENIKVIGAVGREKIFEEMSHSKILIHTSSFEGQCLVYAEALAHGMYVLSFDIGRIETTIKHQICSSEEEFRDKTYKLLTSELNFTPEVFINTEETINSYIKLYYPEK